MSYSSVFGGAERILVDQAQALPQGAALACPEGDLATHARNAGIRVVTLSSRRAELRASVRDRLAYPARIAALGREVHHAVADLEPRSVVGWSMRGQLVAVAALAGTRTAPPLVFCQNDLLPSRGVGAAVRAAASRAQRVVALSAAIAENLDPSGRLSIEVIHPGVDLERFVPCPLPEGPPRALVLGAIVGWKRPDLALEAAALARRRLPDLTLRLAGAPLGHAGRELAGSLQRRAGAPDLAGCASLQGQVGDVPRAFAQATCLLHCAEREPFGVALTEALACGRPVAAPRSGGPLEILDESCGVMYEPGHAHDAARALAEVVGDAGSMSAPARARAERLFDRRVSRERFRAVIEALT